MTLLDATVGEALTVLDESACDNLAATLAQMGIHQGDMVRLIRRAPFQGPVLVEVLGSGIRVALGRGMAAKLLVTPVPS